MRLLVFLLAAELSAATYYIAPGGSDGANGTALGTAWATFAHARTSMSAGDTLRIADGTYAQQLCAISGTQGARVTYEAITDGAAVLDGQGTIDGVIAVGGPCASWGQIDYVTVKGLVAINGGSTVGAEETVGSVVIVYGDQNIFQRVSAYNADTNANSTVFWLLGNDNLVEDAVAGGSGRKMFEVWASSAAVAKRNIFRRVFSAWQEWRGADFDAGYYPWGDGIEFYGASSNIVENSIAYGMNAGPNPGFGSNNQTGGTLSNLGFFGNMAVKMGKKWNGDDMTWTCPSPYRSPAPNCPNLANYDWRSGLHVFGNAYSGVQIQDHFSWGNAGDGLSLLSSTPSNLTLTRATILNNALGSGEDGVDVTAATLAQLSTISDSYIEGTAHQGSGAQLKYRYESSFSNDAPVPNLTAAPLWPWPMEDRIAAELAAYVYPTWGTANPELQDFSVTSTMQGIFSSLGALNPAPEGARFQGRLAGGSFR